MAFPFPRSPIPLLTFLLCYLIERGLARVAFVRRPRGRDIYAACGQLAARRETNASQPALYQIA